MLGQAAEAVQSPTIVEEAETRVEFGLSQFGQALPDILGDDVALTVLGGLVFVDLAASDEDLREVGVDCKSKG